MSKVVMREALIPGISVESVMEDGRIVPDKLIVRRAVGCPCEVGAVLSEKEYDEIRKQAFCSE